jgi:flagellar hook-associated protein 1 FlgK
MAYAFNRTAQQIDAARSGLDAQVSGLAGSINAAARAVAGLNQQIKEAAGAGGSPNDLLDMRQKHLDRLAELTGASFVNTSDGDVNVMVGGVALVAGSRAGSITTRPDLANGGHLALTAISSDGRNATALTSVNLGGTLGGSLSARDGALATTGDRVDQLAYDLGTALNAANGYDPATGTGRPLFLLPAAAGGAAAKMTLAISDPAHLAPPADPAAPGDATNVIALIETESAQVADSQGVQAALASIVSQFGATSAAAKSFADQDVAIKDHLRRMRDSYSGVSIDEEMITIQTAQRGYEAITKVIQAADQMMQTLMNLIR